MQTESQATPVATGRRAWVASILMQRANSVLPRFALAYGRLMAMPRGLRRRLSHRAAVSLSSAALLLALSGSPLLVPRAQAAGITVAGACTLVDAIRAANFDTPIGGCPAGSGDDTITLTGDMTLYNAFADNGRGPTGLPLIESTITIAGAGYTIERNGSADYFRLLEVAPNDSLTLQNINLIGGATYSNGGAVLVAEHANLTVLNGTIFGHYAALQGGAIFVGDSAELTLTDSSVTSNTAMREGGAIHVEPHGQVTDTNTELRGNYTYRHGGAIHAADYASLTIRDAVVSGNAAQDNGGAIAMTQHTTLAVSNSQISNNVADNYGGAIHSDLYSDVEIALSTLSNNEAGYGGGAISSGLDCTLTVDRATFQGNSASTSGGGIFAWYGEVTINRATFAYNDSGYGGGAVKNSSGALTITNSTLSGNIAADDGGAVSSYLTYGGAGTTILNSTLAGNTAYGDGGGIHQDTGTLTLAQSIVSGNLAYGNGHEIAASGALTVSSSHNVLGESYIFNVQAFHNFVPDASDVTATYDGTLPTFPPDILNWNLADNGGPTQTNALVAGSPAIDFINDAICAADPINSSDQRGEPRGVDVPGVGNDANTALCDAGAFELQDGIAPAATIVFVSSGATGTTDDGVAFAAHDILAWDGTAWSRWFDGSTAGLDPGDRGRHSISAFWLPDPAAEDVVLAFVHNASVIPGIKGKVSGMDLVWWDGDSFALWFDGQDVGLNLLTAEKIDALHVLDGALSPVGSDCEAYLLLSTQAAGAVPGTGGLIRFRGEDVLGFCLTQSGEKTSGVWHKLINGRAERMPANSTQSLSFSDDGQTMYLTTRGAFNVDAAAGNHSMVYKYEFATGEFSGPFFVAAGEGLNQRVTGLQVDGELR